MDLHEWFVIPTMYSVSRNTAPRHGACGAVFRDTPNVFSVIEIRLGVLEPHGSKFTRFSYFGFGLLQKPVLPYVQTVIIL